MKVIRKMLTVGGLVEFAVFGSMGMGIPALTGLLMLLAASRMEEEDERKK